MGQMGFFDVPNRYAGLDAKADPLVKLAEVVPWEAFRPRLEAVWRGPTAEGRSKGGRMPWDAIVMFKVIVLCALYNFSDEQVEYQVRDRLSFMRFVCLGLEHRVPDATTVWLYREQLIRRYDITDAAVHDSQRLETVLDDSNTASDVWADSAYRSAEIEEKPA